VSYLVVLVELPFLWQ